MIGEKLARRRERKHRGKIGYPRLIATVKEYGDVIVQTGRRDPREVQAEIWTGQAPTTLDAASIWHYGPKLITVRTSDIVATVILSG